MNELIEKIKTGFGKSVTVTDIFKMGNNYLVHIAPKGHEEDGVDGFYEYDPKVNNVKEFAMLNRGKEYVEAIKNRIYSYKESEVKHTSLIIDDYKASLEDDVGFIHVDKHPDEINFSEQTTDNDVTHYGIRFMKWYHRRFQNEDGSLTPAGRERYGRKLRKWQRKGYLEEDGSLNLKGYRKLSRKDEKWAAKHHDRIYKDAMKESAKEMKEYRQNYLNKKYSEQIRNGRVGLKYVNEYNQKLAEVLNQKIEGIRTPNLDKTISFIAKRGELGAYMSVSDKGYDLSQFKNGIYKGGRVAYKKNTVNSIPAYNKK